MSSEMIQGFKGMCRTLPHTGVTTIPVRRSAHAVAIQNKLRKIRLLLLELFVLCVYGDQLLLQLLIFLFKLLHDVVSLLYPHWLYRGKGPLIPDEVSSTAFCSTLTLQPLNDMNMSDICTVKHRDRNYAVLGLSLDLQEAQVYLRHSFGHVRTLKRAKIC